MRYEIVSQIGKGSSSRVFLVRQLVDDKRSQETLVMKERDASDNAVDEAQLLKTMRSHPCMVQFKDAFLVHSPVNKICIVMERARCDLKHELEEVYCKYSKAVAVDLAARWIAQVALGLAFLHERGIVHRDVKPANLLLLPDGRLVLGDFGASRRNVREQDGTDSVLGTPFYLSPEILLHESYGTKSDVWSFGCVVFEIATSGRFRPFKALGYLDLQEQVLGHRVQWDHLAQAADSDSAFHSLISATLCQDPFHRIRMSQVLVEFPLVVRALGGWIADLAEGAGPVEALPRKRVECLLNQVCDLGLKSTVIAGLRLGNLDRKMRKRKVMGA